MLRTTLCCVLTLAAAAVAQLPFYQWQRLYDTPDKCEVGQGAQITYGAGSIWGVFPYWEGQTYVAHYDPLSPSPHEPPDGRWSSPIEIPGAPYLFCTGITFQWDQGSALYVIGYLGSNTTTLYWYTPGNPAWHEYVDHNLSLGSGACIVFVPNRSFTVLNQVAGYIYCLHGNNDKYFLRYSIEPSTYTASAGIFPPDDATIADQTPKFQWNPASQGEYRLQVSTDQQFGTTIIDTVVYAAEYQTTASLASSAYYWRIGTPDGLNWTWGAVHSFVLQGGWVQQAQIPENVQNGAALAYEGDPWCWEGAPSIIATVGGGSTSFYKYDVATDAWISRANTPKPQYGGTSLTTNDPTGEYGQWPHAAFGGSTQYVDRPYYYDVRQNQWFVFPPDEFGPFLQPLGAGACFVDGPSHWSYLTTGAQEGARTHWFYAIEPKHIKTHHKKGSQAGYIYAGSTRARVITSHDRIEVEYQLPAAAYVRATLHDAVGRQVGVADAGNQQSGTHRLSWNHTQEGRRLGAGAYFVLLDMGSGQVCLKSIVK